MVISSSCTLKASRNIVCPYLNSINERREAESQELGLDQQAAHGVLARFHDDVEAPYGHKD